MKNTEGVPRGRGLAAPESEYPMVLLCVSVCKHSNYKAIFVYVIGFKYLFSLGCIAVRQ